MVIVAQEAPDGSLGESPLHAAAPIASAATAVQIAFRFGFIG
jgi:hypothetical protein